MRLAQLEVDAGADPDALVLEEIFAEVAHPEVGRNVGSGYLPILVHGVARLVGLVVARREKDARLLIRPVGIGVGHGTDRQEGVAVQIPGRAAHVGKEASLAIQG